MGGQSSNSNTSTNGLDPSVSNRLLLSQQEQNANNNAALIALHKDSMAGMKAALAEMSASHASSDRKFEQMVVSMQQQASSAMMSMSSMMGSLMNMMGPAMMKGLSGGLDGSVRGKDSIFI